MKVTYAEGYTRGAQDRRDNHTRDPFRWVKAWAPNLSSFERGYYKGYDETLRPQP